jgi:glutaredoxin
VIEMYGTAWCRDCVRAKRFLEDHHLEYTYHDIDAETQLAEMVVNFNIQAGQGPKRRIPIILINGLILSEPTNAELAAALNLVE